MLYSFLHLTCIQLTLCPGLCAELPTYKGHQALGRVATPLLASVSPPVREELVLDLLGPSETEHLSVLRDSVAILAHLPGSLDAQVAQEVLNPSAPKC